MTKRPSSHILIWRERLDGDGSWGWTQFERPDYGKYFRRQGDTGFIHAIARRALCDNFGAILRNVNVLVGWATAGGDRIEATPAAEVEEMVRRLRPLTVICPERPTGDRWIISNFGTPLSLPVASIQRAIDDFVGANYPEWRPGRGHFQTHALSLRGNVSGEELGLVESLRPTPDDIYASVAEDPAVLAAGKLWDRATPSTHRDLVAAVLAAQDRAGVAVGDRAPLQSGAVEDYLTPLLFKAGKDEESDLLAYMRRDLRRRYGEFAEIVLLFMLRTHRHGGTEKLLALALASARAAA